MREFYANLPKPVLVGLEATGSMHWFLRLLEELAIEFRVGNPARIRAAEPRKQKNDRRDARLLMTLLAENRFPAIWMPSREQHDLQILLRHRDQFVRIRTRVQLSLQALALSHGLRLFSPPPASFCPSSRDRQKTVRAPGSQVWAGDSYV